MFKCSSNMQQICRKTPMQKCDFNKVALQLYWNHKSSWALFWKFDTYLQNTFLEEQLWEQLPYFVLRGFFFTRWKISVLVFCVMITFTRKIIFTCKLVPSASFALRGRRKRAYFFELLWGRGCFTRWFISTAVCRPARIIKIRWWYHWRKKS